MTAQLQALNLSNFTGGLNLRSDAFQLSDSESPEMLNVDVDPRGGVRSRRGWDRWNGTAVGGTWSPTRLHVFEQPDGSRDVMLVNNSLILTGSAGTLSGLSDGSGAITTASPVIGADFADWGSLVYIACGKTLVSRKWSGSGTATALTGSGPTWQDDYTAPTTGYFPKADYACTYQGYMVVASTREDGTDFPNRVRFSHPNNPENWAELDCVDILAGGAKITGLVAFSDHVVVFKSNSVWAIYGNDADSFTPVNLTMTVGAVHGNAIAVSETGAYFYSHPNGVYEYRAGMTFKDGQPVVEVSAALLPIIDSGRLNPAALDKMTLGVLNRRVWWSVPYERDVTATTNRSTFVLDPALGAWTVFSDADGDGLAAFASGGNQGDGALLLAAHSVHGFLLNVEANEDATDTIDAVGVGFPTLYATRWLHADWPALRKSWRRPDYVVSEMSAAYTLQVDVLRDYDESNPRSQHTVVVDTGATGAVWGSFTWGAFTWGGTPRGSRIERGGSIGLARSVQLKFAGEVGKPWGLNTVVMKFRNRRLR